MTKILTTESFIERAKAVHGDKYDYSLIEYKGNKHKVNIICPYHKIFQQTPNNHLRGAGCPDCKSQSTKKRLLNNKADFIKSAKAVHGSRYNYSLVDYQTSKTHVRIICPVHGEFKQTPNNHLRCNGCPKCGQEETGTKCKISNDEFIRNANYIHNNKYDYSKVDYIDSRTKVTIICPVHGEFKQSPFNHYVSGCKKCASNGRSTYEDDIIEYIRSIVGECTIDTNIRDITKPYELDIVIPEFKAAIEFNGIYWHCEKHKVDKDYHKRKLELCGKQGYKLLTIFEDEWCDESDLMKGMIDKLLFGRSLSLESILNNPYYEYQTDETLVTCDRRFTEGRELEQIGFAFIESLAPDYDYFIDNRRISKEALKYENTDKLPYYKIWNCGYNVYKYTHNGL